MTPFERGLVAYLAGDWLPQNEWMTLNKMELRPPAARGPSLQQATPHSERFAVRAKRMESS